MEDVIDVRQLGRLIRAKRGPRGLRVAAKEIRGVSASTLSRVEQGKVPDLDTYLKICRWLGVRPEIFIAARSNESPPTTADVIAAHLRSDRALDPKTADALATMVRLAYSAAQLGRPHHKRRIVSTR